MEPDWVPAGAWLAPGYAEWAPPARLRGAIACLWTSVPPPGGDQADRAGQPAQANQPSLILPDACSDLIWEQGADAFIAGPDTGPVLSVPQAGTVIVGVRFRPAAGGQVLGLPLSELRDQHVALAAVLPSAAKRLSATADPATAAARALDIAGRLVAAAVPDHAVTQAAVLLRNPAARTEAVAAAVGLSERQFRRRCQMAAGYGPKTLQRVLRFQRFVRLLDASGSSGNAANGGTPVRPPDLAAAAAAIGYADQAHLTRECAALSGLTPTALAHVRSGPGGQAS